MLDGTASQGAGRAGWTLKPGRPGASSLEEGAGLCRARRESIPGDRGTVLPGLPGRIGLVSSLLWSSVCHQYKVHVGHLPRLQSPKRTAISKWGCT